MKRKMSIFLSLAALIALLVLAFGGAAETFTVQLERDGVTYPFTTLAEAAAAAADGDILRMLEDETLAETVVLNKSLTLDLNGKTVTAAGTALRIEDAGNVTVTGPENSLLYTTPVNGPAYGIYHNGSGTLTTSGSVVINTDGVTGNDYYDAYGIYSAGSGTVCLNGGSVLARRGAHKYGVYSAGSGDILLQSGVVNAMRADVASAFAAGYGLYHAGSGAVTISGGEVYALVCVECGRDVTLSMTGGYLEANANGTAESAYGIYTNGTSFLSGGSVYSWHTLGIDSAVCNGGTLTLSGSAYIHGDQRALLNRGQVAMTGGTLVAVDEKYGNYVVLNQGSFGMTGGVITIGSSGGPGTGLRNESPGAVLIEGGSVQGRFHGIDNSSVLTVTGGTLTGGIDGLEIGGGHTLVTGGTVTASEGGGGTAVTIKGFGDAVISGGTFLGDTGSISMVDVQSDIPSACILAVNGGFIRKGLQNSSTGGGCFTLAGGWYGVLPDSGWVAEGCRVEETTEEPGYPYMITGIPAFTVTCKYGNGQADAVQTVGFNETAQEPEAPVREGYTFGGWFTDEECHSYNAFDFTAGILKDYTLWAKWDEITFAVTYRSSLNNYIQYWTDTVAWGGQTAYGDIYDPFLEGYDFGGWFTDPDCTSPYDFSTPVYADFDLYAKWDIILLTVTFDPGTEGSGEMAGDTVAYNADYLLPDCGFTGPAGYVFSGWQVNGGNILMPGETLTRVQAEVHLTAVWTQPDYFLVTSFLGENARLLYSPESGRWEYSLDFDPEEWGSSTLTAYVTMDGYNYSADTDIFGSAADIPLTRMTRVGYYYYSPEPMTLYLAQAGQYTFSLEPRQLLLSVSGPEDPSAWLVIGSETPQLMTAPEAAVPGYAPDFGSHTVLWASAWLGAEYGDSTWNEETGEWETEILPKAYPVTLVDSAVFLGSSQTVTLSPANYRGTPVLLAPGDPLTVTVNGSSEGTYDFYYDQDARQLAVNYRLEKEHRFALLTGTEFFWTGEPIAFNPYTDLLIDDGAAAWDPAHMRYIWKKYNYDEPGEYEDFSAIVLDPSEVRDPGEYILSIQTTYTGGAFWTDAGEFWVYIQEPYAKHTYALRSGFSLDKTYDGEPVSFLPASDLVIDGGESVWDPQIMECRWEILDGSWYNELNWETLTDAEGNPILDSNGNEQYFQEAPSEPGYYRLKICEMVEFGGKDDPKKGEEEPGEEGEEEGEEQETWLQPEPAAYFCFRIAPVITEPTTFLTLPAGLTTIEEDAFTGVAAEAVIIPETVTVIVGNPFAGSSVHWIYGHAGTAAQDLADAYPSWFTFVPVE